MLQTAIIGTSIPFYKILHKTLKHVRTRWPEMKGYHYDEKDSSQSKLRKNGHVLIICKMELKLESGWAPNQAPNRSTPWSLKCHYILRSDFAFRRYIREATELGGVLQKQKLLMSASLSCTNSPPALEQHPRPLNKNVFPEIDRHLRKTAKD